MRAYRVSWGVTEYGATPDARRYRKEVTVDASGPLPAARKAIKAGVGAGLELRVVPVSAEAIFPPFDAKDRRRGRRTGGQGIQAQVEDYEVTAEDLEEGPGEL